MFGISFAKCLRKTVRLRIFYQQLTGFNQKKPQNFQCLFKKYNIMQICTT